jgi:dethiobiotin synthetase
MRGVFVTATDTGVGKTYLSRAIAAALRDQGLRVGIAKPVVTGLEEPGPHDHEILGAVTAARFGPPVSPHLAAELAGAPLEPEALLGAAHAAAEDNEVVVVEGVGGLLVPLADDYTVRDLAVELGLPVVVAARPGLGTINHTLLTVEAARHVDLDVRAVVLTPWPARPTVLERSNLETLGYAAPTYVLDQGGDAATLPVGAWLGGGAPALRIAA